MVVGSNPTPHFKMNFRSDFLGLSSTMNLNFGLNLTPGTFTRRFTQAKSYLLLVGQKCLRKSDTVNHKERIQLSAKLTDMMVKKYGGDVLLGGIYGSTAKNTDTEHSDLEMFFVVKNSSKAKSFHFAYEGMPVGVVVEKIADVEKDIKEVELDWPLKMGRLFNSKITCGNGALLKRLMKQLENVPNEKFAQFVAKHAPLCYEGLGRLKAVKMRKNTHETGLFVAEILWEFNLLTAILNKEFINHDYLGGLFEAFKFKKLPKNYEKIATKLLNWTSLSLEEVISLAEEFVHNFVEFATENGIRLEGHTPLEKLAL